MPALIEEVKTTTTTPTPTGDLDISTKEIEADAIIRKDVYWSMGAGLIPVPMLDLAGIAGVQLKMLKSLSDLYGISFSEHRAKNIIAALAGSVGTATLATGTIASMIKVIPGLGSLAGIAALPIVAGGSTYAVGKIFVQHFESGGTFLDFDPAKTRRYFAEQFKEGQKVALETKRTVK